MKHKEIVGWWYLLLGITLMLLSTYFLWGWDGIKTFGIISNMVVGVLFFVSGISLFVKIIREKEEKENEKNRTKS